MARASTSARSCATSPRGWLRSRRRATSAGSTTSRSRRPSGSRSTCSSAPTTIPCRAPGMLSGEQARARAALIRAPELELTLDLTRGGERFGVAATLRFGCADPGASSFADCALDIESATLNGAPLPDGPLELRDLAADNVLELRGAGAYHPDARGVGRVRDEDDGAEYVYTLFEPQFAHRVMPCFDQPDLGVVL